MKARGLNIKNWAAVEKALNFEYVKLLLLHLGVAFIIYIYEPSSKILIHGTLLYFIFIIIKNENRNNEALMAAAYLSGAEVFYRMTDGMVFYETGKYMVIVFLFIGLIFKGSSVKSVPFWIYLLILMPGIVVASISIGYDVDFRKSVAFNLSGPVCLGVSAIYCYYKKITRYQFEKVVVMLLLPLVANMFYLYVYTPSLGTNLNLNANYLASGGYGPNQIATVMGLGAFLLVTRLFVIKNKTINLIDLALLGLMTYRALGTFSRGGVLTGAVCAVAFVSVLYYKQSHRDRKKLKTKIYLVASALFLSWFMVSMKTAGLIFNRYAGLDAAGQRKDDITTGRIDLITTELEGFYFNPVMGVGVGRALEFRQEAVGLVTASHNEISRLLSEHGMLGVLAVVILIFVPILFWLKFKNNYYFLAFMAFWFLTINHSAMRIALPAFVYGLALLYIVDEKKNPVYR